MAAHGTSETTDECGGELEERAMFRKSIQIVAVVSSFYMKVIKYAG